MRVRYCISFSTNHQLLENRIPEDHVEALAQLLKDWRASVCDSHNLMPYHILPTSGIAAIANAVPVSNAELLEIDGLGRTRVKKYGEPIIAIVQTYLDKVRTLSLSYWLRLSKVKLTDHFASATAQPYPKAVALCPLNQRAGQLG